MLFSGQNDANRKSRFANIPDLCNISITFPLLLSWSVFKAKQNNFLNLNDQRANSKYKAGSPSYSNRSDLLSRGTGIRGYWSLFFVSSAHDGATTSSIPPPLLGDPGHPHHAQSRLRLSPVQRHLPLNILTFCIDPKRPAIEDHRGQIDIAHSIDRGRKHGQYLFFNRLLSQIDKTTIIPGKYGSPQGPARGEAQGR